MMQPDAEGLEAKDTLSATISIRTRAICVYSLSAWRCQCFKAQAFDEISCRDSKYYRIALQVEISVCLAIMLQAQ